MRHNLLAASLVSIIFLGGGSAHAGGYDVSIIDSMLPSIGNGDSKSATLLATNKSVTGRQIQMKMMPGTDDKKIYIVQSGGPADDGSQGAVGDLWQTSSVRGSVLGFRVNKATKVTVTADGFKPNVLILMRSAKTPGPAEKAEYVVVAKGEAIEGLGGGDMATANWRQEGKKPEGTSGGVPVIAVLSETGEAGPYTLKVETTN
jgi:hypothetical protein